MSMQAITYAMTRNFDGPRDGLCLYCVAHHVSNENGSCYAGQKLLAKEMHASQKTVQRALKSLEDMELISRTPRHSDKGRQTTDTITLVGFMEWLDQIEGRSDSHPYTEGDKLTGGTGQLQSPRAGHQGVTPRTGLKTKSSTEDSAGARGAPGGSSACSALGGELGGISIRHDHPLYDIVPSHPLVRGNAWLLAQHGMRKTLNLTGVTEESLEEIKSKQPDGLTDRSRAMQGDKADA